MRIFPPSTNTLSRVSLGLILILVAGFFWILGEVYSSPYVTQEQVIRDQPVPFSHDHHAGGLGIDCRYCHYTVERSAFANVPAASVCMQCHSQVWSDSPMLAPVRESYRTGATLAWTRVHDLPDFTYFDHSIHVAKGVGCRECHGAVQEMPLMWTEEPLTMKWCLECHRDPAPRLRPRDQVTNMTWQPAEDRRTFGERLVKEYGVRRETDCYACHR